jgi:hypothetical protein
MLNLQVWHVVITAVVLLFLGGVIGGRIAILLKIVRASEDDGHDPRALLDHVVDEIATLPPKELASWCIHLLRELDSGEERPGYGAALRQVRHDIDQRLTTGLWPEESPELS